MSYDGNGNYLRSYSWVTDKANSVNITASRMDGEDNGFAAGLTLAVTRDGQGKMAANFLPNADAAYDVGSSGAQWINGWFTGNVKAGTVQTGTKFIFPNVPAFNAQRTGGSIVIPASTTATVIVDNVPYDNGNHYNNATGVYTAPVTGIYQFHAMLFLQNNATGIANFTSAYFSKNNAVYGATGSAFTLAGFTIGGGVSPASNAFGVGGSVIIPMAANDTMRLKVDLGTVAGSGAFTYANLTTFSGAFLVATS